jgi:hypothetical protein
MRRREFIKRISGTAVGWPLAAHPQPVILVVAGIQARLLRVQSSVSSESPGEQREAHQEEGFAVE